MAGDPWRDRPFLSLTSVSWTRGLASAGGGVDLEGVEVGRDLAGVVDAAAAGGVDVRRRVLSRRLGGWRCVRAVLSVVHDGVSFRLPLRNKGGPRDLTHI